MNLRKSYCHIVIHNDQHNEAVQRRLFELGYSWGSAGKSVSHYGIKSIQFGGGTTLMYYSPTTKWKPSNAVVVTLDDLYSDKFAELKREVVKLNYSHEAIVEPEGITVGCQKFGLEVLDALLEARKKVLS